MAEQEMVQHHLVVVAVAQVQLVKTVMVHYKMVMAVMVLISQLIFLYQEMVHQVL